MFSIIFMYDKSVVLLCRRTLSACMAWAIQTNTAWISGSSAHAVSAGQGTLRQRYIDSRHCIRYNFMKSKKHFFPSD